MRVSASIQIVDVFQIVELVHKFTTKTIALEFFVNKINMPQMPCKV